MRQNSDLYIGLAGCFREFDELARRFALEFDTKDAAKEILEETKKVAAKKVLFSTIKIFSLLDQISKLFYYRRITCLKFISRIWNELSSVVD